MESVYYSPILNKTFIFDDLTKSKNNTLTFMSVDCLNACVYEHISPDGKKYYGITRQKPLENRWNKGRGYKRNKKFFKDICYFGWDNFQHNKLTEYVNLYEAFYLEYALIIKNKTFKDEYGYNHDKTNIDYFLSSYTLGDFDVMILDKILNKYADTSVENLKTSGV